MRISSERRDHTVESWKSNFINIQYYIYCVHGFIGFSTLKMYNFEKSLHYSRYCIQIVLFWRQWQMLLVSTTIVSGVEHIYPVPFKVVKIKMSANSWCIHNRPIGYGFISFVKMFSCVYLWLAWLINTKYIGIFLQHSLARKLWVI